MNQATPQLAANPARLHYLNSVHGLYLNQEGVGLAELLALAALNSATALSAEISGRTYGGGILKMEPGEAVKLLVPSLGTVARHRHELTDLLPVARRLLRAGSLAEARTLVDNVVLGPSAVSPMALESIREAQVTLSGRRGSRAQKQSRTTSDPAPPDAPGPRHALDPTILRWACHGRQRMGGSLLADPRRREPTESPTLNR